MQVCQMALPFGKVARYDVDVHVNTFTTIYHISPSLKKISGNKKLDQRSGANSKNLVLAKTCCKFLLFSGFL